MLTGTEGTAYFARLKSAPAYLLVGAKGQVNVGLLRLVASEIETRAGNILLQILQKPLDHRTAFQPYGKLGSAKVYRGRPVRRVQCPSRCPAFASSISPAFCPAPS